MDKQTDNPQNQTKQNIFLVIAFQINLWAI